MHEGKEKYLQKFWSEISDGKDCLERYGRRWNAEDVKIKFGEMQYEGVNWIKMA
jgi:hypothetical protein